MSTPVTVALIGVTVSAGCAIVYGGAQLQAQLALQAVADNAALAAADAHAGLIAADPCVLAQTIAHSVKSQLHRCDSENEAITVAVKKWVLGRQIQASARAG